MVHRDIVNLAPDQFTFWLPPRGRTVLVGVAQQAEPLPEFPLPIHCGDLPDREPSDAAIGQGVYDYLRQFPDCSGNTVYAGLLRDAFPHFLADLAAHAVMLDAKQVEPAYLRRKLTCLKILWLLEPTNRGLLEQLARGYFSLALEFSELACCREHLREILRFGQELLTLAPDDPAALSLLAEADLLLGDLPGAADKFRRLRGGKADPLWQARIDARLAAVARAAEYDTSLVEELDTVAEALRLHSCGDDRQATMLMEAVEAAGHLPAFLPSADFYWLLGVCRHGCGDTGGAVVALHQALALEPGHPQAEAALAAL